MTLRRLSSWLAMEGGASRRVLGPKEGLEEAAAAAGGLKSESLSIVNEGAMMATMRGNTRDEGSFLFFPLLLLRRCRGRQEKRWGGEEEGR